MLLQLLRIIPFDLFRFKIIFGTVNGLIFVGLLGHLVDPLQSVTMNNNTHSKPRQQLAAGPIPYAHYTKHMLLSILHDTNKYHFPLSDTNLNLYHNT
jgi:hypothetical protein